MPIRNVLNNISFVVDDHLYLNADAYYACVSFSNSVLIDHIEWYLRLDMLPYVAVD